MTSGKGDLRFAVGKAKNLASLGSSHWIAVGGNIIDEHAISNFLEKASHAIETGAGLNYKHWSVQLERASHAT